MTETKQKRSTRVQASIDDRLSKYLSEEQLAPLSDAEVDVMADFFSNHQLKELRNAPAQVLKGLVSRHVSAVERQRLTNIPEDELDDMLAYYEDVAAEIEIVHCTRCDNDIAVEIKHSEYQSTNYFNNPNLHWQDRFIVSIGNRLQGYRKRHDDVMGYRCGCVIKNPAYAAAMDQYQKDLKSYDKRVKDWQQKHDEFAKKMDAWAKKYGPDRGQEFQLEKPDPKPIPKSAPKMPEFTEGNMPQPPEPPDFPEFVACGNESMMAEPELEAVSEEHLEQSVITNSDVQKIKRLIDKTNYKKPVKKVKDGYLLDDKFLLRKVK